MRHILAGSALAGLLLAGVAFGAEDAGVQPATMEKYQRIKGQVEKLAATKTQKYAPEVIGQAQKSISSAQEGLKSGSDKVTREYTEMAALQVTLAGVKADEREASEKAEAARQKLDGLNKRLNQILSGKGDK